MKSSELMQLAEQGKIDKNTIVIDQDGNEFIFTGKTFQIFDFENCDKNKYYGLCVDDDWAIADYEYVEEVNPMVKIDMSMPNTCDECLLCQVAIEAEELKDGERYCGLIGESVENVADVKRAEFCKLIECEEEA